MLRDFTALKMTINQQYRQLSIELNNCHQGEGSKLISEEKTESNKTLEAVAQESDRMLGVLIQQHRQINSQYNQLMNEKLAEKADLESRCKELEQRISSAEDTIHTLQINKLAADQRHGGEVRIGHL